MNAGNRDGQKRQNQQTQNDYGEEQNDNRETPAFCETGEYLLEATEKVLAGFGEKERAAAEDDGQNCRDDDDGNSTRCRQVDESSHKWEIVRHSER